jgi:hypothetical protein
MSRDPGAAIREPRSGSRDPGAPILKLCSGSHRREPLVVEWATLRASERPA